MRIPQKTSTPSTFEIESIVVSKARPGGSFQSDAYSIGRGRGEDLDYRLTVYGSNGERAFKRRYDDKPNVLLSSTGDMIVERDAGFGDHPVLDVYKNNGGHLKRSHTFGSPGFLGFGTKEVSGFSLNPQGTHLVFSLRSWGRIELAEPKTSYSIKSDGTTETVVGKSTRGQGHIDRVFVHDLESGSTRELGYDRPHQGERYFHPKFQWSTNGKYFAYESPGPSYAYVFDTSGQHRSTYRTRETLGTQGGGAVPLRGVSDLGEPTFPTDTQYSPVSITRRIPLGQ